MGKPRVTYRAGLLMCHACGERFGTWRAAEQHVDAVHVDVGGARVVVGGEDLEAADEAHKGSEEAP